MLQKFLIKKMLKKQLEGVPEAEQEKMFEIIEKNPQLFQKIAQEIQFQMKNGKNQTTAAVEVTEKYQKELKEIMD